MVGSKLHHLISNLQRSVPPLAIVFTAILFVLLVVGLAHRPILLSLQYLDSVWGKIPSWATTLFGLFVVVVVVGVVVPKMYFAFESFVLFLAFGRSPLRSALQIIAKNDFLRIVSAHESAHGATRPFAVLMAISRRGISLGDLIRRLRNVERNRVPQYYRETIERLKRDWQAGEESSVLLRNVSTLQKLLPPSVEERLLGQTVAANITYLFGNLLQGRRLADRNMAEAEQCDGIGLPIYQWLASYAHANSRLFLGQFYDAASSLGKRWHTKYISLPDEERRRLFSELQHLSTVHPIGSVPRHIILASAFAGQALRNNNTHPLGPLEAPLEDDKQWIECWYDMGQKLCGTEEISLHFTHGYMSLYCLVVDSLEDPLQVLDRIPAGAPLVSQYVKDGIFGLYYLRERRFEDALKAFRRADTFSKTSGNRFLDGVFLPAHAAAAVHANGTNHPEVKQVGKRARARARMAQSAFYDSLVDAFDAVLALAKNEKGKFNRLRSRAEWQPGGLVKIYGLAQLEKN